MRVRGGRGVARTRWWHGSWEAIALGIWRAVLPWQQWRAVAGSVGACLLVDVATQIRRLPLSSGLKQISQSGPDYGLGLRHFLYKGLETH